MSAVAAQREMTVEAIMQLATVYVVAETRHFLNPARHTVPLAERATLQVAVEAVVAEARRGTSQSGDTPQDLPELESLETSEADAIDIPAFTFSQPRTPS